MQMMEVEKGCIEMEGEDREMMELAHGEWWRCESTQGSS